MFESEFNANESTRVGISVIESIEDNVTPFNLFKDAALINYKQREHVCTKILHYLTCWESLFSPRISVTIDMFAQGL
jgi:hypothetical protein